MMCWAGGVHAALEGTVYLSNGEIHEGKIMLGRPIDIQDIFTRERISLQGSSVYRIDLLVESFKKFVPWSGNPSLPKSMERNYLMRVTTWEGNRYWGRFSMRVIVQRKQKKIKLYLPTSQVSRIIQNEEEMYYVKAIVFKKEGVSPPGPEKFLSLCGDLRPANVFTQVYAVHRFLGIVLEGKIDEKGERYTIQDMMPGNYDLLLVGKDEVVFGLTPPERKGIMDKEVYPEIDGFSSFVQNKEEMVSSRKLMYGVGRYSDTRAFVLEEKKIESEEAFPGFPTMERRLCLWSCERTSRGWQRKNSTVLMTRSVESAFPVLLLDERLCNVVVPPDGGMRKYDFFADE